MREQQQLIDSQQQELAAKVTAMTQLEIQVQAAVKEQQQVCVSLPQGLHTYTYLSQSQAAVQVLYEERATMNEQLSAATRELERLKAADIARGKQLRALERQV